MKFRVATVFAAMVLMASAPRPTHAQAEAQKEPTKTSEALVAELLTAKDGKIFFPTYMALVERIGKGGADAESTVRLLLGHREEITVEPEVKVLLDTIVGDKKAPLAARLLLQIARAKNTVATFKKGEVVVGRVVLADGKLEPELVLAQMEILPDGYFAAEIGDMQRPLGLRAEGYAGVDVPIQGKAGSVIDLGTITLQPLAADKAASLKGKIALADTKGDAAVTVNLSLSVPPANTPHNGYSPRPRWPESVSVPVSKTGEFLAAGLSPSQYTVIIEAKGHETSMQQITLDAGQVKDAGAITLKSNNIAFYIGKDAPEAAELVWEKDYASALKKAKAEKKPLMIMMTATWCGPCKMLEKETLSDPWIRHFLADFVVVKAYEDRDVEEKYGLQGYPTLVFTDETGKAAHRTVGYQTPLPFAGACAKAFEALGQTPPAELKLLAEKKLLTPTR